MNNMNAALSDVPLCRRRHCRRRWRCCTTRNQCTTNDLSPPRNSPACTHNSTILYTL